MLMHVQMFTDFVAECRADMLARNIADEESAKGISGAETVERSRPIAVAA
jgi:hypothetical protein